MSGTNTKERIKKVEMELEALKRLAGSDRPDFSIDEKNWKNVKKNTKEARKKTYRKTYNAG